MILTITLNPSVDRTIFVDKLLPNDTNRVRKTETDAGGKGINVARVAAELGSEVLATGFLGGKPGLFVKHVLDLEKVPYDFVEVEDETRMNVIVEASDGPPTTFNERGPKVTPAHWEALVDKSRIAEGKAAFVVMGGSIPPGLDDDTFAVFPISKMNRRVVDADGEALKRSLAAKPFMVKPNRDEAERLLGIEIRSIADAMAAARKICEQGIEIAIISMGAEGAAMSCEEGDFHAAAPTVEVVSTVGSGDSLIGGFLHALEQNMSCEEAFRWGIAAGAATATTTAAEICRRSEVEALLVKVEVHR
jgi:1-phosphofructokinase family hexose kinase